MDENYLSTQPKNATQVLWCNINTAEQFRTDDVKIEGWQNRQLIHSCTRGTATFQAGGGDGADHQGSLRRGRLALSLFLHGHHPKHQSELKPLSCWPNETKVHKTKMNFYEVCLASILFLVSKQSLTMQINNNNNNNNNDSRGYENKKKISPLVMSILYRSTLQATTIVQRDPYSDRLSVWLLLFFFLFF